MSFTHRAKRTLALAAGGAMVLGLMPAGAAFADRDDVCENAPENVFNDVSPSNVHSSNIDCIAAYDIVVGVGGGNYNPAGDVRRDQMATYLVNLAEAALQTEFEVPDDSPFTDIAGNTHEDNIKVAYELGITSGVTATTYDPGSDVRRDQMATFIAQAHEALGVEWTDNPDEPFTDVDGNTHELNINRLADAGLVLGVAAGRYAPSSDVARDQMATFIANSAGYLDELGIWQAPRLPGVPDDIEPNVTVTDAPELVEVTRDGDIVTFRFDEDVPGKALDFIGEDGAVNNGDPTEDEVSYYTGLRLYDAAGNAYYPFEAGIFGDEVRARYGSESIVAAAARAGVYENTVQDATGLSNPASDFPLQATASEPETIDPYFPQLTDVSNLRTTDVTPAEILVDYTLTFSSTSNAQVAEGLIEANVANIDAEDFALVGAAGQVFRAEDFESTSQSGSNVTVTVVMDPAVEDVPVSQLRRGFVEEDAFDVAGIGLEHILLSSAWGNISEVNGTTTDPDLRAVERGAGSNQLRFIFDEAVSADPDDLFDTERYVVANDEDERATPDDIGRSLIGADGATVVVATFTQADVPAEYDGPSDYLDEVVAAFVDVVWDDDEDRTEVFTGAARATDQVGSQQSGWNTPAQVLVTPVQPEVPADPTPGVTDIPDLISVEKDQNAITGNWQVTYVFDQDQADEADAQVDFSLYDEDGVRFSTGSRDIAFAAGDVQTDGTVEFSFGPDAGDTTFSNEQIAASVLGTVQDAEADLELDVIEDEPLITEGHDLVE